VLLNRIPSPSETFNDLDHELVNFFKVLRERTDELVKSITLTPFSREELKNAVGIKETWKDVPELECARLFLVRAKQTQRGVGQTSSVGRWNYCIDNSRNHMATNVSRWVNNHDLAWIAQRLLRVQIENDDAISVIQRYDTKKTLFYCDPPYPLESRGGTAYQYELTEHNHLELAKVLREVNGKVAISGYDCPLMKELYEDWQMTKDIPRLMHASNQFSDRYRTEVLWTNYDIDKVQMDTRQAKVI